MDNFFLQNPERYPSGQKYSSNFRPESCKGDKKCANSKKKKKKEKPICSPKGHVKIPCVALPGSIGSLSNDDGDVKENVNNAIGLDWQNHPFLYISLPSLHDYNVKVPIFTFCRGREHQTTTFLFFS